MENRIRLQRFCTEAGAAFASMGCVCNIRCACIRKSILIPSAHGSFPIRTLLLILELNFPSSFVCSSPQLGFFGFIIPTHVAWLRCRLNEARLSLRQAHGSPSAVRSLDLKLCTCAEFLFSIFSEVSRAIASEFSPSVSFVAFKYQATIAAKSFARAVALSSVAMVFFCRRPRIGLPSAMRKSHAFLQRLSFQL